MRIPCPHFLGLGAVLLAACSASVPPKAIENSRGPPEAKDLGPKPVTKASPAPMAVIAAPASNAPSPQLKPPAKAAAPSAAPAGAPKNRTASASAGAPAAKVSSAAAAGPLDIKLLEQRLKATNAIGVLTKLSLKNQVDDLVARFRAFHQGQRRPTLGELRPSFDLMLMKVLSLLQEKDAALAKDIDASRETIWAVLTDPNKLAQNS